MNKKTKAKIKNIYKWILKNEYKLIYGFMAIVLVIFFLPATLAILPYFMVSFFR